MFYDECLVRCDGSIGVVIVGSCFDLVDAGFRRYFLGFRLIVRGVWKDLWG